MAQQIRPSDEILEDFWRKRNEVLDLIAIVLYNRVCEEQRENDEKYRTKRRAVQIELTSSLIWENILNAVEEEGIEFEGYSISDLVIDFYNKNANNERGKYFSWLFFIYAQIELSGAGHYEDQVTTIVVSCEKKLFKMAKITCKLKLSDFLTDFVSAIERHNNDTDIKVEVVQSTFDGTKGVILPLYSEFIYEYVSKMSIGEHGQMCNPLILYRVII